MSRRLLILLMLAVLTFAASHWVRGKSAALRIQEEQFLQQEGDRLGFRVFHGEESQMNGWDYTNLLLLVVSASLTLSAIWLRKK